MKTKRRIPFIIAMILILTTTGMRPATTLAAPGATILVNTTLDEYDTSPNGTCSLREAIESTNTDAAFGGCTTAGSSTETDIITFVGGTHVFRISIPASPPGNMSGDLDITEALVILGNGQGVTIIDASYQVTTPSRVFYVDNLDSDISVTLQDLTIQGGNSNTSGGGAIYNDETLLLQNVTIQDNHTTGSGGAIFIASSNTVTVRNSTFHDNISVNGGGAIYTFLGTVIVENSLFYNQTAGDSAGDNGGAIRAARVTITHSEFSNNSTYSDGGNLYLTAGWSPSLIEDSIFRSGHSRHVDGGNLYLGPMPNWSVTIRNTEISEGIADGNGGGIANNLALSLENVSLGNNHADLLGGGIYTIGTDSNIDVKNCTIAYNDDDTSGQGDGIYSAASGHLDFWNSLFTNNGYSGAPSGHGDDCGGVLGYPPSQGYNLDRGDSCIIDEATGDQTFTDPRLGSLAEYGGFTRVYSLQATSPGIDAANNATCLAEDQRGWLRPVDGNNDGTATCDMGAYEYYRLTYLPLLRK